MTWSQNPNEPPDSPETFYTSKALDEKEVRHDSRIVFDEIFRRSKEDKIPENSKLLFSVNSVNSFVDITWVDKSYEQMGPWTVTLWLNELGDACTAHEDGADEFVRIAKFAIYDMIYDFYWDRYGDEFELIECQPMCYWFVPEYHDSPEYIIM